MEKPKVSDSPARVLSAAFLKRHKNKKDLLRRLRAVVETLSDDDTEAHSSDFPGLDGLAAALVEDRYLNHRDKEVRLHAVLACMEIFDLYAPDPPWDEKEILQIFTQLIRQLANLSHCTSPAQVNYEQYFSLLLKLSEVKIGVVVVEMTRTLDSRTSPGRDSQEPTREEALEVLADLVRTILHCVHIEHPSEVTQNAVIAISACIEDFDGTVPTALLDELLIAISSGPTVFVTNPEAVEAAAKSAAAKKRGQKTDEKMPPMQIQQTNPSYMVAANVIRRTVDRVSTVIASYLNCILNGDPNVLAVTNISSEESPPPSSSVGPFGAPEKQATADVWAIIYELHRISPQILTTVIGTVTHSLQSPNLQKRHRVTKLLGKLFYAPSSQIGVQFGPCFRQWLGRCRDANHKVRLTMVRCLVSILSQKGDEPTLAKDAASALVKLVEGDPNLDVRLQAVHHICDLAYNAKTEKTWVPGRLLQAVGSRVSSKSKVERRDALTGLAQVYNRHYVHEKLKQVQQGGDDCDIDIILSVLHDTCHAAHFDVHRSAKKKRMSSSLDDSGDNWSVNDDDDKYKWIPCKVFESVYFSDATDTVMRNRVVQIVDDVLLGNVTEKGEQKKEVLTPTSRAVALAFIVDSTRDQGGSSGVDSNAYKFMCSLFAQRAKLQNAIGSYIDARAKLRECDPGTEQALTADADAMEKLDLIASLSAPLSTSSYTDIRPVLEKLHGARDKHIFRLLATISSPTHSSSARTRAFDELPKRTKSLGENTSTWVKMLARRCAMGNFLNLEVVEHCILLAQECFRERDMTGCMSFLSCVKMTSDIFPAVCGTKNAFGNLIELFRECQRSMSTKKKKKTEENELVTVISSILSSVAPARSETGKNALDDSLKGQLLGLCTKDGTPEQARHAVYTMAALLDPSSRTPAGPSLSTVDQVDGFGQLLQALTAPSRLVIAPGETEDKKIVGVLTALAALAESAPSLFNDNTPDVPGNRGNKAIKFALSACLLGRRASLQDGMDAGSDCEDNDSGEAPDDADEIHQSKSRRSKSRTSRGASENTSPIGAVSSVEDKTLSHVCRRSCAAIELLVSHVRSSIMFKVPLSETYVKQVFGVLSQILRDGGLPPASRDRRSCKSRHDRAALRQCAATHLLCLCDGRLKLEEKYLTGSKWHSLASIFLDEEKTVREAVMDELCMMMRGQGHYGGETGGGPPSPPSLRLVAMVTLCTDGDHIASHAIANGNAAVVGKRTHVTKNAAMTCIANLRKTSDAALAQCRAVGRDAEHFFDNQLKPKLMPEYSVPFALHLLCYRRETPFAGGSLGSGLSQPGASQENAQMENGEGITVNEEHQHKVLRKRLKWLFEPLVLSLGDGADNISFLLRMTELLGNHYHPCQMHREMTSDRLPQSPDSMTVDSLSIEVSPRMEARSSAISVAKLRTVCVASREILLSFVKKDVNLTPYPGAILLPSTLFGRSHTPSARTLSQSTASSNQASVSSSGSRQGAKNPRSSGGILRKHQVASNRDSLSSMGSGGSLRSANPRDSQESGSMEGRGRVHFSPEIVTARHGRQGSATHDAFTSSSHDEGSEFGGLSPIGQRHSPPLGLEGEAPDSPSETKTIGTTPPSILRTVPNDEGSTDEEVRSCDPSPESASPKKRSRSRRTRASGDLVRKNEETSKDDGSLTTSETRDDEVSPPKKRKVASQAPTRGKSKAMKSSTSGVIQIEMGTRPTKDRHDGSARASRLKSKLKAYDEFDFVEESQNEKENDLVGRRSNRSNKVPSKKSKTSAKHTVSTKEKPVRASRARSGRRA